MSDDPKCRHGVYLGTYECSECTGPLSDAELDLVRLHTESHKTCVPKCYFAPSGETARLLATVDFWRMLQENSQLGLDFLSKEAGALRAENKRLTEHAREQQSWIEAVRAYVASYGGACSVQDVTVALDAIPRLLAEIRELKAEIGARHRRPTE